jgi:membrane peptidoglycan carboxypeptidase
VKRIAATGPIPAPAIAHLRGRVLAALLALTLLAALVFIGPQLHLTTRMSRLQAGFLAMVAAGLNTRVEEGPSPAISFPSGGPYDQRLGYTRISDFTDRLAAAGYRVTHQARLPAVQMRLASLGIPPVYHEKALAGLTIEGSHGGELYAVTYPERVYGGFDDVAPLIVRSLLFIENRELLDPTYPNRNPAIEWDRLGLALLRSPIWLAKGEPPGPGGSTLATQLQKLHHSPGGLTTSPFEKLRQMTAASLRAYLSGTDTTEWRRQLVVDYLNGLPQGAVPGYGEITGLASGLHHWYGADYRAIDRLLRSPPAVVEDRGSARATAYRKVLTLLLAARRPSHYLLRHPEDLVTRTRNYLDAMVAAGVIDPQLYSGAMAAKVMPAPQSQLPVGSDRAFARDVVRPIRARLAGMLGMGGLHELDRLDLNAVSTLDERAQTSMTALLRELRDPEHAQDAGVLPASTHTSDDAGVVYSMLVYERTPNGNLLRIDVDSLDQPMAVNDGIRLDLGSTAKLRTVATYLELLTEIYARVAPLDRAALVAQSQNAPDPLTRWTIERRLARPNESLSAFLDAALLRTYSGSPYEGFYTGGGRHHFQNFDRTQNDRVFSVRGAFRESVNLVFIRMMREMVEHILSNGNANTKTLLTDPSHPDRRGYLERFVDHESAIFLRSFYDRYRDLDHEERLDLVITRGKRTPRGLALVLRFVEPNASFEEYRDRLSRALPGTTIEPAELEKIYVQAGVERFSLQDRAYLSRVHPLELWLVARLLEHPAAKLSELVDASGPAKRDSYQWLFKSRNVQRQNRRIRDVIERDAFAELARRWQRLGYPFESITPSYASALGASGDRPAALAELMGIILNDGLKLPARRLEKLHFAAGTPYETVVQPVVDPGVRVMDSAVAAALRGILVDAVAQGTARRAHEAIHDAAGKPLVVGGKTGTGDHKRRIGETADSEVISRQISRSGTFAFFIGDRFFGTVTAFVTGDQAGKFTFTSSLATQLFRSLAPALEPLVTEPPAPTPSSVTVERAHAARDSAG